MSAHLIVHTQPWEAVNPGRPVLSTAARYRLGCPEMSPRTIQSAARPVRVCRVLIPT